MQENSNKNNNGKKIARIILIIIALLMVIFGAISFAFYLYENYYQQGTPEATTTTTVQADVEVEEKVKNPIDFKSLQKKNNEIYAWIKVPGTEVDYPICQSEVSDDFYLKHSATDKSWLSSGAIYTESANSLDFTDRVTVIYGHNGYKNATMFTSLHKFESADFFTKHEKFYIYTPDSKLTYQIVSAFKYDDRHIMNCFDFQDNTVFMDFIKMIQNPDTTVKNVRNPLDNELTINDNIVVLSTCITNQRSNRYLVCGVLIKNEKTN